MNRRVLFASLFGAAAAPAVAASPAPTASPEAAAALLRAEARRQTEELMKHVLLLRGEVQNLRRETAIAWIELRTAA